MAADMLALRWHARDDIRLDMVPVPLAPRDGEVQVHVLWVGICATDIEEWKHGPIFVPENMPHPLTGSQAPLILGHELTGEIVALGAGVANLRIGDRVAVDGLSSCGECVWCVAGRPVLCESLSAVGLMSDGGLAEFCNVPAKGCFLIPRSLEPDVATLAETLAVGVRALSRGRFMPGESVLVIGAGAVGLLAMQAARALGASHVSMVERDPERRALASELGADAAVDAVADAPPADLILECSGSSLAAAIAVGSTKPGGRVVLVGLYSQPVTIDALAIVTGEREILGSLSHVYNTDFATAVSLLSEGAVHASPLISHRVGLEDAVDVFAELAGNPAGHLKVVVSPRKLK